MAFKIIEAQWRSSKHLILKDQRIQKRMQNYQYFNKIIDFHRFFFTIKIKSRNGIQYDENNTRIRIAYPLVRSRLAISNVYLG